RTAAHIDDLSVQSVLLEDPGVFGDKKHAAALVQPTVGHDDLRRRRGGKERNRINDAEKKNRKDHGCGIDANAHVVSFPMQVLEAMLLPVSSRPCQTLR